MKTFTNHTPGARGIRTKAGLVMLDPGQSAKIDPDTIVGEVPDLGKKGEDQPDANDDLAALQAQVTDLTKQVETLTKERDGLAKDKTDLTKQVETLTKPAGK